MANETTDCAWVPVLSGKSGTCLTLANWMDAGVTSVSLSLASLLMKPGLDVLAGLTDIRSWCKWPGKIVLNALLPPPDQEYNYRIRSIYDGSLIQIGVPELFALIARLKADIVILPPDCASYYQQVTSLLPKTTVCFHAEDRLPVEENGVNRYWKFEPGDSFSLLLPQLSQRPDVTWIVGEFDGAQMSQLASYSFESDKPAQDGMAGMVYSQEGPVDILADSMRTDMRLIDSRCRCPTCSQALSRGYLHHLLQQTPLLAQRFLVQHNAWYCVNSLK